MDKEAQERGAGEILFTSMNHDGVKTGYANEALSSLADGLSIPIIASGGAGAKEHFRDVFCREKLMLPWQPVFFISEKSKFPN